MNKFKNKKLQDILIILLGFIFISWQGLNYCQNFIGLNFDEQAFLYWNYVKEIGLIPFKEYFYPYGLIFYLKQDSLIWHFSFLVVQFFSVLAIFAIYKKIFSKKYYYYSAFIVTSFYIGIFTGINVQRYLPLIIVIYLVSLFSAKRQLILKRASIILGISLGLIFSFINEIFIYGLAVYVLSLLFFLFVKKLNTFEVIRSIFIFLFALFVGSLPLIIFLTNNNSFTDFFNQFAYFKDIALFAKIPFLPSLRSFENLYIIFVIICSIFYLFKKIQNKKNIDLRFFLILNLTISIVCLEQKNILRPMFPLISYFAIVLSIVLFSYFRERLLLEKIKDKKIFLLLLNLSILVITIIYFERNINTKLFTIDLRLNKENSCVDYKISKISEKEIQKYISVVNFVNTQDKNVRIFSYPSDPIYYILFNQTPPYYQSIYEATPVYAQKKLIDYIKNNDVNIIIINTSSGSIQDGVPDKNRVELLYTYLINNFQTIGKEGNFVILKNKK